PKVYPVRVVAPIQRGLARGVEHVRVPAPFGGVAMPVSEIVQHLLFALMSRRRYEVPNAWEGLLLFGIVRLLTEEPDRNEIVHRPSGLFPTTSTRKGNTTPTIPATFLNESHRHAGPRRCASAPPAHPAATRPLREASPARAG